MVTEELISYIKTQLDAGIDRKEIMRILKSQGGWEEADVAETFAKIGQDRSPGGEPVKAGDELAREFLREDSRPAQNIYRAPSVTPGETAETTPESNSILGAATEPEVKSGGKKAVTAAITVIVLLGILAGAAYGYFTYFKSPKPYDILSEMIAKSMEVTSAQETGEVKLDLSLAVDDNDITAMQDFFTSDEVAISYLVSYDMAYDISDAANQKVDGFFTLELGGDMGVMKVNFEGTVDVKMVDNIMYFRLRDTTPFMDFDLSPYEDRWVELDFENLMPGVGIDLEELIALQLEQQEEIQETLQQFLDDPEVIDIVNRSGSVETITDTDGNKEYHLTFQINKADWNTLAKKAFGMFGELAVSVAEEQKELMFLESQYESPTYYDQPSMEELYAEMEEQLDSEEAEKVFEILENLTVQMWVTKNIMLPRKSVISLDVTEIEIEDEYAGDMTIGVAFSAESETDYDVSVEIMPPTDATPFYEFMEEVTSPQQKIQQDVSIKSNLMMARVQAELHYDDNDGSYGVSTEVSKDACLKENTMFTDEEVSSSLEYIIEESIGDEALVCGVGEDGQSYVISAKLNDGLWFCIDSTGNSYETDQPLSEGDTACPKGFEKLEEIDW
jgi:hypothetical protein